MTLRPGPANHSLEDLKYERGNPIRLWLVNRFVETVQRLLHAERMPLLDIGCGEGHLSNSVLGRRIGFHLDIDFNSLRKARGRRPSGRYVQGSIYALPFKRGLPNTVLCLEVLEHLEKPADAVAELASLAGARALVSVPNEPWFSWASLIGGKHLWRLGRHPGHINAWSTSSAKRLLSSAFVVRGTFTPFPWSLFDCSSR